MRVSYKSGGSTMCESAEISFYAVMSGLLKTGFFEVLRHAHLRARLRRRELCARVPSPSTRGPGDAALAFDYDRPRTPHWVVAMGDWYEKQTLGLLPERAAWRWGPREALAFQGARWTFAELDARVDAVAKGLLALGIAPGDKVALWMVN